MEYRNNISAIDSNMDTPVISTVQLPMTESLDALNFSNPYPMAKSAGNTQQDVDENEKCNAAWPQMKKKRRMSVEQTRSLEKIFEVENKLQPERKSQIALELGLPPRQVTVWFQNKRSRCKTKDLEKDYILLKSNYDDLRSSFEALQRENEKLATELNCLKEKLEESEKARGHNHDLMTDSCPENGRSVSGYGIDNSTGDTSSEMRLNGKSEGSLRNQISGYVSTSSQYCYNAQQLPLWDWP